MTRLRKCGIYASGILLTMKKNEILSFISKWMKLENIILSEVCQAQKAKNRMLSLMCRLQTQSKCSNIIGHRSHDKGRMYTGGIGKGKET
jgi:hypothetical protein